MGTKPLPSPVASDLAVVQPDLLRCFRFQGTGGEISCQPCAIVAIITAPRVQQKSFGIEPAAAKRHAVDEVVQNRQARRKAYTNGIQINKITLRDIWMYAYNSPRS